MKMKGKVCTADSFLIYRISLHLRYTISFLNMQGFLCGLSWGQDGLLTLTLQLRRSIHRIKGLKGMKNKNSDIQKICDLIRPSSF